ncbi:MAG: S1 RNA-binding domain-containing protein [Actinobacteria bacterium]|nr:S1 RNA-binding domain-containing protein [Actinomycetota bacterium]
MPHHVVVDGSNIATEGRDRPSLRQLNEAVMAYIAEHPDALITVVVDATFGHRIDPKEVPEFDEAVNNNELVAPPAGAIGRGDAFVLSIANKVNAIILTNDSYQEFHGQYDWLFDEGRLVGGKPVPHIGWVFVNRLPVRGPISRKSTSEAKKKVRGGKPAELGTARVGSPEASKPMPVPTAPPPGAVLPGKRGAKDAAKDLGKDAGKGAGKDSGRGDRHAAKAPVDAAPTDKPAVKHTGVNDLLSFLTFVERHPLGTSVNAIVDHYSSHGAYVKVGDVVGYVPLRLMADPAPRSAREFMKVGEAITLAVDKFIAEKRSIDLAVPGMGTVPQVEHKPAKPAKPVKRVSKKAAAAAVTDAADADAAAADAAVEELASALAAPAKPKRVSKKAAAAVPDVAPAKKAPAKKAATKKAATPAAPVVEAPVEPARAKKAPAKKAAAKKAAPAKKA